ncbi:MAG: HAMP domain-containing protein, partial [Zoogloea sp.]|nr:HAMP domain-containing protein [Zoogloea sp.]
MKNMKIGTRLGLAFAVTFALILAISAVSIARIASISDGLTLMIEDRFPKTVWANDIIDSVNVSARGLRNAVLLKNDQEIKAELQRVMDTQSIVADRLAKLDKTISTEGGRQKLKAVEERRTLYVVDRDKFIELMQAGKKDEAVSFLLGSLRQTQRAYIDSVGEIIKYQTDLMKDEGKAAEALAASTKSLLVVLTLLAVLFGSGFAYFIIRDLLRKLGGEPAVAQELAAKIAAGDLSTQVIVKAGDTTSLMASMKQLSDGIQSLVREMNKMSREHEAGDIDVRIDDGKFAGEYAAMAKGVNEMVFGHIAVKKKAVACFKQFGEGNLDAQIEVFPGKKHFINDTIEQVRSGIKALVDDAGMLSKAAVEGRLATRADASRHQGDFRKIVEGVNETLDAVIGPLNVAANYVDRISKGDIPAKITDTYNGDFNVIKNNLN